MLEKQLVASCNPNNFYRGKIFKPQKKIDQQKINVFFWESKTKQIISYTVISLFYWLLFAIKSAFDKLGCKG